MSDIQKQLRHIALRKRDAAREFGVRASEKSFVEWQAADEIKRLREERLVKYSGVLAEQQEEIERLQRSAKVIYARLLTAQEEIERLRAALERAKLFIEENMRHTALTIIDEALKQ